MDHIFYLFVDGSNLYDSLLSIIHTAFWYFWNNVTFHTYRWRKWRSTLEKELFDSKHFSFDGVIWYIYEKRKRLLTCVVVCLGSQVDSLCRKDRYLFGISEVCIYHWSLLTVCLNYLKVKVYNYMGIYLDIIKYQWEICFSLVVTLSRKQFVLCCCGS